MTCHAQNCDEAVCHVADCAKCNAERLVTAFCETCRRDLYSLDVWCPGVRDCYDEECHRAHDHDVVDRDDARFAELVRRWM